MYLAPSTILYTFLSGGTLGPICFSECTLDLEESSKLRLPLSGGTADLTWLAGCGSGV